MKQRSNSQTSVRKGGQPFAHASCLQTRVYRYAVLASNLVHSSRARTHTSGNFSGGTA